MSDRAALLASVLAAPDDDAPRLVYADWLDIDGPPACRDHERAKLIRYQCGSFESLKAEYNAVLAGGLGCQCEGRGRGKCRLCRAVNAYNAVVDRREDPAELVSQNWRQWAGPAAAFVPTGDYRPDYLTFRRGFVASVTCTAADWLAHGDALSWSPEQTVPRPLAYEEREPFACKVCANVPDETGMIEHGRGCYTQDEDGGGSSWVELPPGPLVPRPCPPTAQPIVEVRLATLPSRVQQTIRGGKWGLDGRPTRHDFGDRMPTFEEVLRAEWPAVKTWNLPET